MTIGRPCPANRISSLAHDVSLSGLRLFLAVLLAALAAAGCSPPAEDAAETPDATAEPVEDVAEEGAGEKGEAEVYSVRGEVVELRAYADPPAFMVHHEAIDTFKGITGEVWGMDAMTMPFEIDPDVPLDGIADGDKVAFTLRVDWSADSPQVVTAIEKLPADTELEFRKAEPPAPEEADPAPEEE